MRHQGRKPSQGQANHAKQDRRRQLQISRQRLAQTDDDQQRGNDDQYKSYVEHRRRELLYPKKEGRPDALLRARMLSSVEPPGHRNRKTLLDSGSLGAAFDRVAPRIPTVIASASEAISGRECPLGRDCFVAQGAPRNDSGNLVKICSSAAQQRRFDLIFYCAAAELLG